MFPLSVDDFFSVKFMYMRLVRQCIEADLSGRDGKLCIALFSLNPLLFVENLVFYN